MPTTRQFLVTMSVPEGEQFAPDKMANRIAERLLVHTSITLFGMVERTMFVIPLPDLAADDTHLQIGFRNLAAAASSDQPSIGTVISKEQAAALVAELSKEKPGRTGNVDQAALDAVRQIREVDKRTNLEPVQKDARAQLIITDTICLCLLERTP